MLASLLDLMYNYKNLVQRGEGGDWEIYSTARSGALSEPILLYWHIQHNRQEPSASIRQRRVIRGAPPFPAPETGVNMPDGVLNMDNGVVE
jgi:hypothetical protein